MVVEESSFLKVEGTVLRFLSGCIRSVNSHSSTRPHSSRVSGGGWCITLLECVPKDRGSLDILLVRGTTGTHFLIIKELFHQIVSRESTVCFGYYYVHLLPILKSPTPRPLVNFPSKTSFENRKLKCTVPN